MLLLCLFYVGVKSELKDVAQNYSSDIIKMIALVLDLLVSGLTNSFALGIVNKGDIGAIIALGVFTVIGLIFMVLAALCNACAQRKTRNCCVVFFMDVLVSVGALLYFLGDNFPPILKFGIDFGCNDEECMEKADIGGKCLLFLALLIFRISPLLFKQCKANEEENKKGNTNKGEKEKKKIWWYPFHMLGLLVEYNAIYVIAWREPFLAGQECQIGNPNSIGNMVSWAAAGAVWVVFIIVYFFLIVKAWKHCRSCVSKCSCSRVLGTIQLLFVCFIVFPYLLGDNSEPIICLCNSNNSTFCSVTVGLIVRSAFIWLALAVILLECIITGWMLCKY